jgi:hypothetical protein
MLDESEWFVPAAKFNEIVATMLRGTLEPMGFELITPRRWVNSTAPPIRPIFELRPLKSGCLSPSWGFSLDYVPHISGASVKWHRTPRTALFDLCNDPLDAPSELPGKVRISSVCGLAVAQAEAADVIPRAVARAKAFWDSVSSESNLLAVFEYLKTRPSERFEFYNYIQHPLAYAFTLARLGRPADAKREFKAFLGRGLRTDLVLPRLRELLQMASAASADPRRDHEIAKERKRKK